MNKNSSKEHLVEDPVTYDFTLYLRIRDHTTWVWRYVETAFGHFLLGSHNFTVTALGSCVRWPQFSWLGGPLAKFVRPEGTVAYGFFWLRLWLDHVSHLINKHPRWELSSSWTLHRWQRRLIWQRENPSPRSALTRVQKSHLSLRRSVNLLYVFNTLTTSKMVWRMFDWHTHHAPITPNFPSGSGCGIAGDYV